MSLFAPDKVVCDTTNHQFLVNGRIIQSETVIFGEKCKKVMISIFRNVRNYKKLSPFYWIFFNDIFNGSYENFVAFLFKNFYLYEVHNTQNYTRFMFKFKEHIFYTEIDNSLISKEEVYMTSIEMSERIAFIKNEIYRVNKYGSSKELDLYGNERFIIEHTKFVIFEYRLKRCPRNIFFFFI